MKNPGFKVGDRVQFKYGDNMMVTPAWQGITGVLTQVTTSSFTVVPDPGQDAPSDRGIGVNLDSLVLIPPPTPEEIEEARRGLDRILGAQSDAPQEIGH